MTGGRVAAAGLVLVIGTGCAGRPPQSAAPDRSDPAVRACLRAAGPAPWQGVVRAAGGTVSIDAADDYFAAGCVLVPWDRPVRMTVTNRGHLPHDVTLPGTGLLANVDAGQTVFVTLPPTRVPLRFVCSYHVAQHMFGAIVPLRPARAGHRGG